MQSRTLRLAFNRGLISRLGLARADVARTALAAETMTNFMARKLGSMMIRPGTQYIGATQGNQVSRNIPFVFSSSDKAKIEITTSAIRVWVSDALVARPSISTAAVTNGNFTTDVSGWTDSDEAGATSAWVTGGYLGLTGDGSAAAIRDQAVTHGYGAPILPATSNGAPEHALRIVIQRGPVIVRIGTTAGADDLVTESELATGTHSLAFAPTTTAQFHIRFMSRLKRQVLVDSCTVEAAGTLTLPVPFDSSANLDNLRYHQSGDIIFIACSGYTQRRIERRSGTGATGRGWSIVQYVSDDGPFRVQNVTGITVTPGALSGNTTLTASASIFKSTHAPSANNAGALFRVSSDGQRVTASITAANQFTNAIEVTGTGSTRNFTVILSGTWTATVTLQRSLEGDTGPWTDVTTYTANNTATFADGLDNQIAYYRIGVKTGDFTSGTVSAELNYSGGSIDGVCRVTGYTSGTVVNVEVIKDFGATTATTNWSEGLWSDFRGWPSATRFFDGRLWWTGKSKIVGSVSDDYHSFDDSVEGDSAPINRSIGAGPVDTINWIVDLERMVLGAQGAEYTVKSSSLDEPLTPTNFQIKVSSELGSSAVDPVRIDDTCLYAQSGGVQINKLSLDAESLVYKPVDVTALVPEVCEPRVVRMAVQRRPDTRVHTVLSDGTVAVLVFDDVENVLCWLKYETDGDVEDVCVVPGGAGDIEDAVYYQVKRTINGATVRYHEKWATEAECRPDSSNVLTACKLADCHKVYSGAATTTITGASHVEGKQIVVWADGADVGTNSSGGLIYTVSGGQFTLATAASNVVYGLPYTASWKSSKLVELAANGSMTDMQRIAGLSVILADLHPKGLKYGKSLTESEMNDLPTIGADGQAVGANTLRREYTMPEVTFPGGYSHDERLCLLAKAPRPVTVLAAIGRVDHHG